MRTAAFAAAALLVVGAISMQGCASHPDKLPGTYTSPYNYQDMDCAAIDQEMRYIGARVAELHARLLRRYERDKWQAGFVWLWGVTALFLDGDGPEADEYRRYKGEFEALRVEGYHKGCKLDALSPEEIIRATQEQNR